MGIEPRLRVDIVLIAGEHLRTGGVLGCDHAARLARQLFLELGLDAIGAPVTVVDIDPTDDLGRQGAVRIHPLGIRQQVDAGIEVVGVLELPNSLGYVVVHPPLEDLVLGGGVLHPLEDVCFLHTQDIRQALGDKFLVGAVHRRHLGVGDDQIFLFLLRIGEAGALFQLGCPPFRRRGLALEDVFGRDDHVLHRGGDR